MTQLTPEQSQLVEKNMTFAHYIAKRFKDFPIEREDLIQVCLEGLIMAAIDFKPEKGFKFATFATKVVKNKVLTEMRSINKWQKLRPIYIEDMTYNILCNVMEKVEDNIARKEAIVKALRGFNGGQRKKAAAIMFVKNPYQTQMEIASKTGTCQVTVSRGINALQKQLKKEMAE